MKETLNQDISQNQFIAPSLNLDGEYSTLHTTKSNTLKNALNLHIEGYNSEGYWVTNKNSNEICFQFPLGYTYKGSLKLDREQFVIYFVQPDGETSEIGIFDATKCGTPQVYTKWGESKCFNFQNVDYIDGVWRYDNISQGRKIYINDGVNPDRIFNIDRPYPREESSVLTDDCKTIVYTDELDCEQTLSNQKINYPCVTLTRYVSSGMLPNGRYQVALAGSDGQTYLTDYVIYNDLVVYSNSNTNSVTINISGLNTEYSHYHLVLIATTANGQNAYSIGHYRASESYDNKTVEGVNTVIVDTLLNKEPIDLQQVLQRKPYYITSRFIVNFNDSLIKGDIKTRQPLYYQSQANKIKSTWNTKLVNEKDAYKYPQHMRDEVYAYFIEWYYRDGEKTEAFHIPNNTDSYNKQFNGFDWDDVIENDDTENNCNQQSKRYFELYSTAVATNNVDLNNCTQDLEECDSQDFQIGDFGIYESNLKYPDFKIKDELGNDTNKFLFGDLACKPIKLHKFPDNNISPHYLQCDDCENNATLINVLGISFSNIEWPKDQDGKVIEDIVGYRILRSNRANNESIISKGIFANMWYDEVTSKSFYPTIGYGSLENNPFISSEQSSTAILGIVQNIEEVTFKTTNNSEDLYTYISPEVCYTAPRQGSSIKMYNTQVACVTAKLHATHNHPRHLFLTEFAKLITTGLGTLTAILNAEGSKCTETTVTKFTSYTEGTTNSEGKEDGKITGLNFSGPSPLTQTGPATYNGDFTNKVTFGETDFEQKVEVSSVIVSDEGLITVTLSTAPCEDFQDNIKSINGVNLLPPVLIQFKKDRTTADTDLPATLTNSQKQGLIGNYNLPNAVFQVLTSNLGTSKPVELTCKKSALKHYGDSNTTNTKDCNSINKLLSERKLFKDIPVVGEALNLIETSMTYFLLGTQAAKTYNEALESLLPNKQYGYQIDSEGVYNYQLNPKELGDTHRNILNIEFIQPAKVLVNRIKINNAWRVGTTIIRVNKKLNNTFEDNGNTHVDTFFSRIFKDDTSGGVQDNIKGANHYGAVYNYNPEQYGNLYNNDLLGIGCIYYPKDKTATNITPVLFEGDTYITRFRFKNPFLIFEPTFLSEKDGFELDYRFLNNIGYPSYWLDSIPRPYFSQYNPLNILTGDFLKRPFSLYQYKSIQLPVLGGAGFQEMLQVEGKIITSINSVYNFFVESSYINDYRQISELQSHLESYDVINRSDKWTIDNQFLYDQTLRLTELHTNNKVHYFNNYVADRDRFKVAYSESITNEDEYDRWNLFRPLNYMQLNKTDGYLTGMVNYLEKLYLFFEDSVYHTRPQQSLLTNTADQVYLGTGDIYSRGLQKLAYEDTGLTGTVDRYSIKSSRHGLTWVDRKRKKIFLHNSKLDTISNDKCTMWFQEHIDDDPSFSNSRNELDQLKNIITIYDNHYDILYYTHKRYTNGELNDCGWTMSYKPGIGWISFHSFIPNDYLTLPNNFLSVITTGIWLHDRFKPNGINDKKYQCYYGNEYPYYFTFVSSEFNSILQSIQMKHETTTEYSFDERKFHNNLFFNKFNAYSEYGNTGELDLIVKDPKNRNQQFLHYGNKCVVSHIEQNQWRLNNFRNFAICQPHHRLSCNGFTPETFNICTTKNPRETGTLRGDWFAITFKNDLIFDKRFKTFININLVDKIKV
jgi:hypothetical protein